MVSYARLPKGRRRPSGKRPTGRRPTSKILGPKLQQVLRGFKQKPGGTKPKPKAVPKGTKTGPAVKGEMSTRPKKPDYRPKGVRTKDRVLADVKGIRDPKFADRPLRTKSTKPDKGMQGLLEQRPKRPVGRKPSKRPTGVVKSRGPIEIGIGMPRPGSGPRPKPKTPKDLLPSRPPKKPTRRPSRRPRGMMDAIRRGMRGRRRGPQR